MRIELYRKLPKNLQAFARKAGSLLPYRFRLGAAYWKTKKMLAESETWNAAKINAWQFERMKEIISYAHRAVPGYALLYKDAGITPNDFQSLRDINHFPFVTKELLRDNIKDFTSREIPEWKRLYRTTGGSTGIPFGFFLTQDNIEREIAFLHFAWERVGWKLGSKSAVLRGAFIGSEENFWEYDNLFGDLRLSSYYLTEKTYPHYKNIILKKSPQFLQAYPSAATVFADLISAAEDEGVFNFKALLLGSENYYEWQKARIQKAFPKSKLFAWYGDAEQVLFAPMCQGSEDYHLEPLYGYAEILNEKQSAKIDETGELVGTSFWNRATPFIRYRTMDFATLGGFSCDKCSRQIQLLKRIDGRLHEFIVTKTGRFISMTMINMHNAVFDNVKQFQFHQREKGKVAFKIVKNDLYTEADTRGIYSELKAKLGNDIELQIEFVDEIEKFSSGKFRFLKQELPLQYGDYAGL